MQMGIGLSGARTVTVVETGDGDGDYDGRSNVALFKQSEGEDPLCNKSSQAQTIFSQFYITVETPNHSLVLQKCLSGKAYNCSKLFFRYESQFEHNTHSSYISLPLWNYDFKFVLLVHPNMPIAPSNLLQTSRTAPTNNLCHLRSFHAPYNIDSY